MVEVKKSEIKKTIDRMVEQSIREQLPQIMSEVLVRTIASAGVIREAPQAPQRVSKPQAKAPQVQREQVRQRPAVGSLREMLDDQAGAEFYGDPRAQQLQEQEEEEAFQRRVDEDMDDPLESRLANLPPALAALAEDIVMRPADYDNNASSDDIPLRRLDFSGAKKMLNLMEGKKPADANDDALRRAQFEATRLQRLREKLEVKA